MVSVISISPGTREIGIAAFVDNDLRDWQVKTFKGLWSQEKQDRILEACKHFSQSYQVCAIAIKEPQHKQLVEDLAQFIEALKSYCYQQGIGFFSYSLMTLKERCKIKNCTNKQELMENMTTQFPELLYLYHSRAHRIPYYMKLFEAISVGNCCVEDVQNNSTK